MYVERPAINSTSPPPSSQPEERIAGGSAKIPVPTTALKRTMLDWSTVAVPSRSAAPTSGWLNASVIERAGAGYSQNGGYLARSQPR